MRHTHSLVLVLASTASPAAAQGVQGGDVVVTDFGSDSVFRITPAGAVSSLHSGAPLTGPSGIAVDLNRDVIVADFSSNSLFRMVRGGPPVAFATGLAGPIRVAVDRDGSYLVTELSARRLSRVSSAGAVTPIASTGFSRPIGVAVDGDGDYLVADDNLDALFKVTPAGVVSTVHQGPPFQLPQGVAVLATGDYAVMDGLADAVFLVPRGGGPVTTLVATPVLGNPCGIHADFAGGLVVSESSASGNRVALVDPTGQLTTLASGPPFQNLEVCAKVPHLTGPGRAMSGQRHPLQLELPAEPNRFYFLYASASLYPGFSMPGVDPRGSPCNGDGLFFASLGAAGSPFFGFTGQLDASGRASASLDVPASISPPPGFTIHVQGFALNFITRRNGIGTLSNVHALPF